MASGSPVVALLSIKPVYVREILAGRKKVEFRKRSFKRAVTHVVIYATAPVQRVVGWFRTRHFEQMSPAALWKKFSSVGGISQAAFDDYFGSASAGVAIHVSKPQRLLRPIPLSKIHASTPPQSYSYLPISVLAQLASLLPLAPKRLVSKRKPAFKSKAVPRKRQPRARRTD